MKWLQCLLGRKRERSGKERVSFGAEVLRALMIFVPEGDAKHDEIRLEWTGRELLMLATDRYALLVLEVRHVFADEWWCPEPFTLALHGRQVREFLRMEEGREVKLREVNLTFDQEAGWAGLRYTGDGCELRARLADCGALSWRRAVQFDVTRAAPAPAWLNAGQLAKFSEALEVLTEGKDRKVRLWSEMNMMNSPMLVEAEWPVPAVAMLMPMRAPDAERALGVPQWAMTEGETMPVEGRKGEMNQ